jgi:Uma2 family endonuclease
MSQAARKIATYEDVLAVPEHQIAEVIDGELYVFPRPARLHTRTASALGARLYTQFDSGPVDEGGDWVILDEPELHLRRDILVPDLAGWRVERFTETSEDESFYSVAPDWVCEVLSLGTARVDRMRKVPIYAREGVTHVWLVDPRDRTIEVLRRREMTYELVGTWGGDEGPFTLPPFDAVPLPASAFWGRALPSR